MAALEPVVLFAPIGPNPAPLSELIWALHRQRGMRVEEAFVVVDRRGLLFLEGELLRPGEILDQLRRVLGPDILDRDTLHVRKALLEDGSLLQDDHEPRHARLYNKLLWATAREAIAAAGPRRVVFGLIAGRRRTMTALQSSMYQLLARKNDVLIDVRVSDPRVEGGTGYFFPEQELQDVAISQTVMIQARSVDVILVDVSLPRLRGLLESESLATYEAATQATQVAVDQASMPSLVIDLVAGTAEVDGEVIDLSVAELVWYAYLASARLAEGTTMGWVIAGQDGHAKLREFLLELADRPWMEKLKTKPLRDLLAGEYVDDEDLRNMRGKTVQKLKAWCASKRPRLSALLVPEVDNHHHRQRLALRPEHIALRGLR